MAPQGWDAGMQGWWAEMGRAAGCSCSLCRSSSLWDLGNLVTSGSLRVAQLCPAWEKEMENLRTEQEGKAGAAVGRPGLPVFPLLAEEGGKSHHLGKKKEGRANCSFFCCCCHGQGYQARCAELRAQQDNEQGELLVSHPGWRRTEVSCCRNESREP